MITSAQISILLDIAAKSIEVDDLEAARRASFEKLSDAYRGWQRDSEIFDTMEKETPEWARMQSDTTAEYEALVDARRIEANARKRLKTAIRKFRTTETGKAKA